MRILVCPASFKGVLTARQAAEALAVGVRSVGHEAQLQPLADGGEGTLEAILQRGGTRHSTSVVGPDGNEVVADWGVLPDGTALIEMAQASGLSKTGPAPRVLTRSTTFGTGQLIAAARDAGAKRIVVGLGGSATNDGGLGALRALGAVFRTSTGRELREAGELGELDSIQPFAWPAKVAVVAACDVDNPLTGPEGATLMFGRQKGATPADLEQLEQGMRRYEAVLGKILGRDVGSNQGAGAAGGLGVALLAFLDAGFRPGVDVVMDAVEFDAQVDRADALLTGEGRLDAQSLHGKAVAGVVRHARGKPVLAVCGSVDLQPSVWKAFGIREVVAASSERPPPDAGEAAAGLARAARALLTG